MATYTAHLSSDATKLVEFSVQDPNDALAQAKELAGDTHEVMWIRKDDK